MSLPSMRAGITSREFLRVAGGYGAPALGESPAGGLDVDNAGNLATDGAATVRGVVSAGSTPAALTNASGQVLGGRIADGTVGTTQLADDSVTPAKVDATQVYEFSGVKLLHPWDGIVQASGGSGHLLVTTDAAAIRFASGNTTSQTVECFRLSTAPSSPSAAAFHVYDPGTTTAKHTLRGDGYAYHATDVYVGGNVSAASFTDRSPVYLGGRALETLQAIRAVPGSEGSCKSRDGDPDWADVDHDTLGPMRVERMSDDGLVVERDLTVQLQLVTAAALELLTRVEALENKEEAISM